MSKQTEKIKELVAKREQARLGGGEKAIEKQHARGKYTARERIEMLVDKGRFANRCMYPVLGAGEKSSGNQSNLVLNLSPSVHSPIDLFSFFARR